MNDLKNLLYTSIQNNREIFDFIQNFALNGYWIIDPENKNDIYFNPKLLSVLGNDLKIEQNSTTGFFLPKKELDNVITAVNKESKSISTPVDLKISYPQHSGTDIIFNCKAISINNLNESNTTILVAHNKYSKVNKDLDSFTKYSERFEQIIEGTNIGTWEWNLQTGDLIFNEKWANILGYNLSELEPITTKTYENLVHPEDTIISTPIMEDYLQGKTDVYEVESRFKHKFGEWIWIKNTGKVVSWSPDGKPEWMVGSHQEITDSKKHELLLEKYQDLLNRTNEAARIGTWEVDLKKNEVNWSHVTKQIHEVSEDYVPKIDDAIKFYSFGKSRKTIEDCVQKALTKGQNYDVEVEIITNTGKRKWVRAIGISDFQNGECNRLYGFFHDIQKTKEIERISHERQTLLETILNSIDVGVVSCDREGNLTLFNKATKEWHGLPVETIAPSEFSNHYGLFHVDGETSLKMEEIPLLQALYTGEVSTKEFIISPNNGTKRNIVATGSQLLGEDGNVFGAVVAMQNITNIKLTEQKLRISEAAFRGNFENAAIGMAILNEHAQWLEVNDQLSKIVGYTREELLNLNIFNLNHKDDVVQNVVLLKEFIAGNKSHLNNEQRFIHKDGSIVYVILSVSVVKNDDGKPLYFIGQITDITQRKIANQNLQEAMAKLETIMDSSTHVSIIGTNFDGTITTFNKGAENLLGYSREEMIGKETLAKIHLKEEVIKRGEELTAELNKKIEGFDVFRTLAISDNHDTREWTYVRRDGVEFPVQLTVTPLKNNNKIIGYLGVAAEITEIKRVEKEMKSLLAVTSDQNERLKNFAHIVSHNLRSHSGNFEMLLTLFIQDFPEADDNEIMNMLKLASENLNETITHLNEVVQINTNVDESLVPLSLLKSTEQAIRNVARIANDAEVSVINNVKPEFRILGLPAYIDSIILNFLTNGIKYRSLERDSYVKLAAAKEGDYIVLSIEDNGLGIDLKKHGAKIFGMYKTFHKHEDSRGIGLFITKNQIESLGGKIELESEVDKGTTFKIYFKYEEN